MRKLVFLVALLCFSTQSMAQDPCASLQGKSLSINGNGYKGVIGASGLQLTNQNNTFTFQAIAKFGSELADPVTGECKGRHIKFTRTREGAWTQTYDGWIFEKAPFIVAGTFSHNSNEHKYGWWAEVNFIN